jgi:xylan 1,4-beta-xylosidase
VGQWIALESLGSGSPLQVGQGAAFRVIDRGRGRIALQVAGGGHVSVAADGKVALKAGSVGDAETFQWVDLQRGDVLLLSLATHRYVVTTAGVVSADHAGPAPDRRDGSVFKWKVARQ